MPDDASIDMILYVSLLPEEEGKLRDIENDVLKVLFDHGLNARPCWASKTNNKSRTITLGLLDNHPPTMIFTLPASELINLTRDKLLSRLNESMGQQ